VRLANDADMLGYAAVKGEGLEMVATLAPFSAPRCFRDGELMPHMEIAHMPACKGPRPRSVSRARRNAKSR